jgi:hypothetical protein
LTVNPQFNQQSSINDPQSAVNQQSSIRTRVNPQSAIRNSRTHLRLSGNLLSDGPS